MDNQLTKDLVAIVLQYLNENNFHEAARMLEQESGIFFNVTHLEKKVIAGEWEELERYLLGFIKLDGNDFSVKTFFEIRKQKYLEALDSNEKASAVNILQDDLKVFSSYNEGMYKEMANLLTLKNFREHKKLRDYVDAQTSRSGLVITLKNLVESNPTFRRKLDFPSFSSARLVSMLNQSLNMQHSLCENRRPQPVIETLLTDHECKPTNVTMASFSAAVPSVPVANNNAFQSLGVDRSLLDSGASTGANRSADLSGTSAASFLKPAVATATCMPNSSSQGSRLPSATLRTADYPRADHDRLIERLRSALSSDEGPSSSTRATTSTIGEHITRSLDDLPRIVACNLHQGSGVTSMDFHPTRHTLLLVGSTNGEVALWELRTEEKVVSKPFMVWEMDSHSPTFQTIFSRNRLVSVIRALWSPDGGFIGVTFNKHLIHLYAYAGSNDLQQLLEVEAHIGMVNDLAFVHPYDKLCIATCGDDKLVKVWDFNGQKLFSFEGHQAPVYSLCPNQLEDIQFIMSISIDGIIKAWIYDDLGSRVEFTAPGLWCTTLLYSDDRSRLFSCGTSREGNSFLVEWTEKDGTVKRIYRGLTKKPAGSVVRFDTTQNKFLAVGEDGQIKFWDMNNADILFSTHAEGGLSSQPRLRFNKEGNLLAVSTIGNGFKILATDASLRSLRAVETSPVAAFRSPSAFKATSSTFAILRAWNSNLGRNSPVTDSSAPVLGSSVAVAINVEGSNEGKRPSSKQTVIACENGPKPINNEEPITLDGVQDKIQPWQLAEITHPFQCQQITVPQGNDAASKVLRLVYTHSGAGLFALGSNGILTVWKWQSDEQNPGAKATTRVPPQQWKPESPNTENVMTNIPAKGGCPDDHVSCLILSRNDRFAISAYGADASLFDTRTFEFFVSFNSPPPATTCVVFYPLDNNIVAVGLDDSMISIYDVRKDHEIATLKGHTRGITGLAFSTRLNILISSGVDGMLCAWDTNTWMLIKCVPVNMMAGAPLGGETGVQFHPDNVHFLVTHQRMLTVYNAFQLKLVNELSPRVVPSAPITCATYSGDGQLVYASFCNGSVWVLEANTLRPRCRVALSAYFEVPEVNGGEVVYPLTIAAHPQERNQFAIGLTDGSIKIMEPLASEGEWGKSPPSDE